GKDRDIYVIDPRNPKSDRLLLTLEGGGWVPLDWSPDDTKLLVGQEISANESHLWVADVAAGTKTLLTHDEGEPVEYAAALFARDGKGVYASTDRGSACHHLAFLAPARGAGTPLAADLRWDVDEMQ